MKSVDVLRDTSGLILAAVGAGGKSSFIFRLAKQIPPPVVITTTTHLWYEQALLGDKLLFLESGQDLVKQLDDLSSGYSVVCKPGILDGRVGGPAPEILKLLAEIMQERNIPLLIEADGSRMHSIKAPDIDEPNIPSWVNVVVVVVGMNCIGKPLTPQWVHRSELFSSLVNAKMGDDINSEIIADYLLNPHGGLKNIPIKAKKYVLLNQADTEPLRATGAAIAKELIKTYNGVMIGRLNSPNDEIVSTFEPSAGVVLAAGDSSRMGVPKQLLEWNGIPFVRHAVQIVLESELDHIAVVVGANREMVINALEGLHVDIVSNDEWAVGQSSSVKAGTQWAREIAGCAIFIPCDQPFITPALLNSLLGQRRTRYSSIIIPNVQGKRTSPVLFGAELFNELMSLSGDIGGRALFNNHRVAEVEWEDDRLLLDIDNHADYQNLLKLGQG